MASYLSLVLLLIFVSSCTAAYNVVDFGAKPDGRHQSSAAFSAAWEAACHRREPTEIYVPQGRFLVSSVVFRGPCNNSETSFIIDGTIVAPSGVGTGSVWLNFDKVDGLSIIGGTIDGQGNKTWAYRRAKPHSPGGATSLLIMNSKNVMISGLTSTNSKGYHIIIQASSDVIVRDVKIRAPGRSPNTDGIHTSMSNGITILRTNIGTGDDCISMVAGTTNVFINQVYCGPGHGISIGSLGRSHSEETVANITATNVTFRGTENGFRIKSWATGNSTGEVTGIAFEHAAMHQVYNPIIIDQHYCPMRHGCPTENSGIKISDVLYSNIWGSSATKVAVKFDCSASNPCSDIRMENVDLTFGNKAAHSYCSNVQGTASRVIIPRSCF